MWNRCAKRVCAVLSGFLAPTIGSASRTCLGSELMRGLSDLCWQTGLWRGIVSASGCDGCVDKSRAGGRPGIFCQKSSPVPSILQSLEPNAFKSGYPIVGRSGPDCALLGPMHRASLRGQAGVFLGIPPGSYCEQNVRSPAPQIRSQTDIPGLSN